VVRVTIPCVCVTISWATIRSRAIPSAGVSAPVDGRRGRQWDPTQATLGVVDELGNVLNNLVVSHCVCVVCGLPCRIHFWFGVVVPNEYVRRWVVLRWSDCPLCRRRLVLPKRGLEEGYTVSQIGRCHVPIHGAELGKVYPLTRGCVEPPARGFTGRCLLVGGLCSPVVLSSVYDAGCVARFASQLGGLSAFRKYRCRVSRSLTGGTETLCRVAALLVVSAGGEGTGAAGAGQASRASLCLRRSSMRVTRSMYGVISRDWVNSAPSSLRVVSMDTRYGVTDGLGFSRIMRGGGNTKRDGSDVGTMGGQVRRPGTLS